MSNAQTKLNKLVAKHNAAMAAPIKLQNYKVHKYRSGSVIGGLTALLTMYLRPLKSQRYKDYDEASHRWRRRFKNHKHKVGTQVSEVKIERADQSKRLREDAGDLLTKASQHESFIRPLCLHDNEWIAAFADPKDAMLFKLSMGGAK